MTKDNEVLVLVDNRRHKFADFSIRFGSDTIKITANEHTDMIFDAMSINLAKKSLSVSNGVFKSLREELGVDVV